MSMENSNVIPLRPMGRPGSMMSLGDLPPMDTQRWVTRRKKKVVDAVRSGVITLEEACTRYKLSAEEFMSWERLIDRHGVPGLRATRIQHYRAVAGSEPLRAADSR